jgi:hypothetical protein
MAETTKNPVFVFFSDTARRNKARRNDEPAKWRNNKRGSETQSDRKIRVSFDDTFTRMHALDFEFQRFSLQRDSRISCFLWVISSFHVNSHFTELI